MLVVAGKSIGLARTRTKLRPRQPDPCCGSLHGDLHLYLLLERPGAAPQRIKIDGDTALVGRAAHCDVVIDEEFVSKQHLRVMRGLVAVDLSSNGTFIEGERIQGGVLIGNKPMQIARSEITIRVEDDVPAPAPFSVVPSPIAQAAPVDASGKQVAILRRELEEMATRLASKEQARSLLAQEAARSGQELAALRTDNERLRARVEELEKGGASAELPSAPPADASAASMLLFKLQRENAQLKRALAQAEQAPAAKPEAAPGVPFQPVFPVPKGFKASSPSALPTAESATSEPVRPPSSGGVIPVAKDAQQPPAEAPPAVAPLAMGGARGVLRTGALARLSEFVTQDAEATPVRSDDPLDAFLLVEGFRFLRRVERVITRLAGGLIQLYQLHTMVPGVEGNLRDLVGGALASPGSGTVRDELLDYLKELGRWMVVSLSAYRLAAERFAAQLREELSAEALQEADPISMVKRVSGKSDAELWRRVCEHLRSLTPDRITERLEKLAREAADELSDRDASQAFP